MPRSKCLGYDFTGEGVGASLPGDRLLRRISRILLSLLFIVDDPGGMALSVPGTYLLGGEMDGLPVTGETSGDVSLLSASSDSSELLAFTVVFSLTKFCGSSASLMYWSMTLSRRSVTFGVAFFSILPLRDLSLIDGACVLLFLNAA